MSTPQSLTATVTGVARLRLPEAHGEACPPALINSCGPAHAHLLGARHTCSRSHSRRTAPGLLSLFLSSRVKQTSQPFLQLPGGIFLPLSFFSTWPRTAVWEGWVSGNVGLMDHMSREMSEPCVCILLAALGSLQLSPDAGVGLLLYRGLGGREASFITTLGVAPSLSVGECPSVLW